MLESRVVYLTTPETFRGISFFFPILVELDL